MTASSISPPIFFLNLIKESGKSPNFWMSEEYIQLAKLKWWNKELCGFKEEDGLWFFPPYCSMVRQFLSLFHVTGFQNEPIGKFWDNEFIYDPKNFLNLSGNQFKIFRRNVNKNINKQWEYRRVEEQDQEMIIELFVKWSEGKNLYDPETFTRFVLLGKNRFGLFLDGELKGVNIADANWKYINYRICFDSGEEFLNEFLRWKFYTSDWVQEQNKLVNDGGCLGQKGLRQFKMKLRPIEIKEIYSGAKT